MGIHILCGCIKLSYGVALTVKTRKARGGLIFRVVVKTTVSTHFCKGDPSAVYTLSRISKRGSLESLLAVVTYRQFP